MISKIILKIHSSSSKYSPPLSQLIIKEFGRSPFLILISCLLSLRSKDLVTINICRDLFKQAATPQEILAIPLTNLEKILFKIGFYKNKTKTLKSVSFDLIKRFNGEVPNNLNDLLSIKGIGRKTANLVLCEAFSIPAICVDVHVHRISNRLGILKTKNVEETEKKLAKILPKKYWCLWNKLLVVWGQNICTPISPHCSKCPIKHLCQQIGVTKTR